MTEKEKISELINANHLGVISSVTSNCLPQSAVVGISLGENLELLFGTNTKSRKYINLLKNPYVSMVIGWDKGKTIQYEGEAVEIRGQTERREAVNSHLSQVPSAAKFFSDSESAIFRIVPKWICYTDSSSDPWDKFELKF